MLLVPQERRDSARPLRCATRHARSLADISPPRRRNEAPAPADVPGTSGVIGAPFIILTSHRLQRWRISVICTTFSHIPLDLLRCPSVAGMCQGWTETPQLPMGALGSAPRRGRPGCGQPGQGARTARGSRTRLVETSGASKGDTRAPFCSFSERASTCLGLRAGLLRPTRLGTGPATGSLLWK